MKRRRMRLRQRNIGQTFLVVIGSLFVVGQVLPLPGVLGQNTTSLPVSLPTSLPWEQPTSSPETQPSVNGTSPTMPPILDERTSSPVDACGGLSCLNGGICQMGNATYNDIETQVGFHTVTNQNGYHCQCPPGFGGLDCSRPYQSCTATSATASGSDARCYHGGTCLPETEVVDVQYAAYCECSQASYNGQRYAGKYCEVAVQEEAYCPNLSPLQQLFCLNGGSCPTGNSRLCSCPEGYFGEHCEYITPQGPLCTLQCYNEGVCRFGRVNAPWGNRADFYCDCPRGYGGVQCEHLAEICNDGKTTCLHGATCQASTVTVDGKALSSFSCACPNSYLGGSTCQEKRRMELCNPKEAPEYSLSMAVAAFCLNGGKCKDIVEDTFVSFGCDCPPLFEGPHCEFLKTAQAIGDVDDLIHPPSNEGGAALNAAAGMIAACSLVLVVAVFVLRQVVRSRKSRRREEDVILNLQSFRDENFGAISANGSMLFPGISPPPSTIPEGKSSNFTSGELLHDIDIS